MLTGINVVEDTGICVIIERADYSWIFPNLSFFVFSGFESDTQVLAVRSSLLQVDNSCLRSSFYV